MEIVYLVKVLFSLPKTIYFNFRCFPIQIAFRLPVFIYYGFRIDLHNPHITFQEGTKIKPFMIRFGSRGSKGIIPNRYGSVCIRDGNVQFGGFATFAYGSSIRVSGELKIGSNFSANRNTFIACSKSITIKEDVLTGWNVSIRDTDGHTITHNGVAKKSQKEVYIGKHVWLCSYAHILKGVTIGDGSIVGYRATVTKLEPKNNCLIVGFPAKVVQENVDWGKYRPELEEKV